MKLRNMTSIYLLCGDEILLLYRRGSRVANNTYISSAGGHFEQDELNDPRRSMLRELKEELCLEEMALEALRLRYITSRLKAGEVRQIYYYFARIADKSLVKESSEGELEWFKLKDILMLVKKLNMKPLLRRRQYTSPKLMIRNWMEGVLV